VTCERAKLASSMCITKSIRTKWSSFEETTSRTAAGKRFCRKNTLVACNDLFSECLCRYEDPKQDILIGLLRSVFILLSLKCAFHGTVCVLSRIPPWLQASQDAPHLRPSAPNSQYAPSPEPKTYRSVFFPVSLSCFTCPVTLLLQVRSRQSFFRAERSVNNSTDSRRLLHCSGSSTCAQFSCSCFGLFALNLLLLQVWKCGRCQRARWQPVSAPGNFVLAVTMWSCY